MQHGKQPFWARLQLLEQLTLNAGKHTGNQPVDWLRYLPATMVPSPRRVPHTISRSPRAKHCGTEPRGSEPVARLGTGENGLAGGPNGIRTPGPEAEGSLSFAYE